MEFVYNKDKNLHSEECRFGGNRRMEMRMDPDRLLKAITEEENK